MDLSGFQTHVDEPADGDCVDFSNVSVRGWVALDIGVLNVVAVEIWDGERLASATTSLYERSDVISARGLTPGTRNGFTIPGVAVTRGAPLSLKARLSDGRRVALKLIDTASWKQSPLGALRQSISPESVGIEIGAHVNPIPGIIPFYTDAVASYAGLKCNADFLSHATALPLADGSLDYVCSSHVLEHLPNPVAALFEWHRVLRPGGHLYLVVPDRRYTFDEGRQTTPVRHLLADFLLGASSYYRVTQHIDEFVFQTDWRKLRPECPEGEEMAERRAIQSAYLNSVKNRQYIDIHYHTFTPQALQELLLAVRLLRSHNGFEAISWAERYPPERGDGIGVLLTKCGSAERVVRDDTFQLHDLGGRARRLPLVCPVSLSSLQVTSGTDGTNVLASTSGDYQYEFSGEAPALIPPGHVTVRRKWNSMWNRWATFVAGRGRLLLS